MFMYNCVTNYYISSKTVSNEEILNFFKSIDDSGDSIGEDLFSNTDWYGIEVDPYGNEVVELMVITQYYPEVPELLEVVNLIAPDATILYDAECLSCGECYTNIPERAGLILIDDSEDVLEKAGLSNKELYPQDEVKKELNKAFPDICKPGMSIDEIGEALSEIYESLWLDEYKYKDIAEFLEEDSDWY